MFPRYGGQPSRDIRRRSHVAACLRVILNIILLSVTPFLHVVLDFALSEKQCDEDRTEKRKEGKEEWRYLEHGRNWARPKEKVTKLKVRVM